MPDPAPAAGRITRKLLRSFDGRLLARPARTEADYAASRAGPVVVAGLLRTASGIGEAARACSQALTALGIPHTCVDLSPVFEQVDMASVQTLGPMPDAHSGTVILHLNAPETRSGLAALGLTRGRRWRIIGHWVWELERAPGAWADPARHLSEIWTPSAYSAQALAPLTTLPVRVVPHYVEARPAPEAGLKAQFGLKDDAITVLAMMDGRSSLARKNLHGTLDAYLEALGDRTDCQLVIKTRNLAESRATGADSLARAEGHPGVKIIDASLPADAQRALMAACDIFLSLHRAEGFGLTLAEAMALGKPVIATNWSAPTEFMDGQCAMLVPFDLVPVEDPSGIYTGGEGARWAAPRQADAVAALRRLANDPALRAALGAAGRQAVATRLATAAYQHALLASAGR